MGTLASMILALPFSIPAVFNPSSKSSSSSPRNSLCVLHCSHQTRLNTEGMSRRHISALGIWKKGLCTKLSRVELVFDIVGLLQHVSTQDHPDMVPMLHNLHSSFPTMKFDAYAGAQQTHGKKPTPHTAPFTSSNLNKSYIYTLLSSVIHHWCCYRC